MCSTVEVSDILHGVGIRKEEFHEAQGQSACLADMRPGFSSQVWKEKGSERREGDRKATNDEIRCSSQSVPMKETRLSLCFLAVGLSSK